MLMRRLCAVVVAMLTALVVPGTAHADVAVGGVILSHMFPDFPDNPVYDYSPTVVQIGSVQHYYWCGYGPRVSANGASTDNIYYRTHNVSTGKWSDPVDVFGPSLDPNAWDARFTCNPAVITGSFTYNGASYKIALYYVATQRASGTTNDIGVAFSNDWINFVRDPDPVIVPAATCSSAYGVGQPTLYNSDGGSALSMFYFDSEHACNKQNTYNLVTSTDGVHFGPPQPIATNGFVDDSVPSNISFGYDKAAKEWYAAAEFDSFTTRPGERGATYSWALYRIQAASLLTGATAWHHLTTVDTNLTGYEIDGIPSLTRDKYGNVNVPGLYPDIQAAYGVASPRPAADSNSTLDATGIASSNWAIAQVTWRPGHPLLDLRQYYSADLDRTEATTGWVDTTTFSADPHNALPGALYETPTAGANRPLYGCRTMTGYDYFISRDPTCESQKVLGVEGYAFATNASGRKPLYRCWTGVYHFISNTRTCRYFTNEGLLGYAAPPT